jgi:predicted  nucleic acid-binding Zn-ribbon protein
MAQMEDHINRVNNKLQQLLKQYLLLQKENEKLKETLKDMQLTREQEIEEINRLQQQVSILKTSIGQMTEPDKKAFEKQINQYIKEIDKCVSLLSE